MVLLFEGREEGREGGREGGKEGGREEKMESEDTVALRTKKDNRLTLRSPSLPPSLPPFLPQEARQLEGSTESVFHAYVKDRHKGLILPPFNDEARRRAGMREEWYLPLVTPKKEGGREGACEVRKEK
jgi:hypothetical protein